MTSSLSGYNPWQVDVLATVTSPWTDPQAEPLANRSTINPQKKSTNYVCTASCPIYHYSAPPKHSTVMLPKLCPRFTTHPPWTQVRFFELNPSMNHIESIRWCQPQMNNKMIQGTSANSTCWAKQLADQSLDLKHFVAWVSHRTRIRHLQGHTNTY